MYKKIIFLFLGLFILGIVVFLLFPKGENGQIEITNFEECVLAGYAVMETYPRQCMTEDGEAFFEEMEDEEEKEYYGSSTKYPCEEHGDCVVAGCNSEICTGVDEGGMASICIYPDEPLPLDLGYKCGCYGDKCQWGKD